VTYRLLLLVCLVAALLPVSSQAAALDHAVPNGWWYSQAGVPNELGFAIVDDGQARFWSEFKRLGGVDALGYPVSQRFVLDGFTVQATQRVVMQWRPESGAVAFVNVFDKLHDLGQDGWLRSVRQTPEQASFDEGGKAWEQIVRDRLALMDGHPAIKAKYLGAVGDPVAANGLPTSPVVDVGNNYALRAQRVVFQEWKVDVPWARAGDVTVALGGDIFKENGRIPSEATRPSAPPEGTAALDPATASPVAATSPGPGPSPIAVDAGARTAPLSAPPAQYVLGPGDFAGSSVVVEAVLDAAAVAQGHRDPASYLARLAALGYVRGFRRTLARDGGGKPLVAVAEVDLFKDPDSARAYVQLDARENLVDPALRLDPLPSPTVGEESSAFRIVDGEVAARGYAVLFRRANAVCVVSLLAQVAAPSIDDAVALARAKDARLR
jgi:hypothetical protein